MMMNKLTGRCEVDPRPGVPRCQERAGPPMPVKESHRSRLGMAGLAGDHVRDLETKAAAMRG